MRKKVTKTQTKTKTKSAPSRGYPIDEALRSEDIHLRCEVIQLYERGLLSGQTLLEKLGFDSAQEIQKK